MACSGAGQPPTADIVMDTASPYGYTLATTLQARFAQSAAALLTSDGWSGAGPRELVADLALEGGGVKGIGIVGAVSVLAEAGYRLRAWRAPAREPSRRRSSRRSRGTALP